MKLIDAEALKHRFAQITYIRFTADMGQGGFEMFSEKEIEEIINKAPAVESQRPRGEWIGGKQCSVCGNFSSDNGKFCTNCGASMRGKVK